MNQNRFWISDAEESSFLVPFSEQRTRGAILCRWKCLLTRTLCFDIRIGLMYLLILWCTYLMTTRNNDLSHLDYSIVNLILRQSFQQCKFYSNGRHLPKLQRSGRLASTMTWRNRLVLPNWRSSNSLKSQTWVQTYAGVRSTIDRKNCSWPKVNSELGVLWCKVGFLENRFCYETKTLINLVTQGGET